MHKSIWKEKYFKYFRFVLKVDLLSRNEIPTGALLLTFDWENAFLKVIRQNEVSEIHLRRHSRQTEVVVYTQVDSGDGFRYLVLAARDAVFNRCGAHQVDQSIHLVIPVLFLFPRFRRISRFAVLHRVHATDFNERVDSKDFEIFQRSKERQTKSNAPSHQHQNANELPGQNLNDRNRNTLVLALLKRDWILITSAELSSPAKITPFLTRIGADNMPKKPPPKWTAKASSGSSTAY